MMSNDDLPSLSDAQLIAAFVGNVQACERTKHVGAHNRLVDQRGKIEAELKARSGGTLEPFRALLDHPDPNVRHVAAIKFRTTDHAVFERTMRALAEREDEIGRDAKHSLEWDTFFQQVGYPEHQTDAPYVVGPFAGDVHWQANNPPPAAMTWAEIERMLADALPPDCADLLLRLIRPAIGLWPQRPAPDMPVGASRLGGMPHAPSGWSWPMVDTEPMLFLGQINCAGLRGLQGADELPASGLLALFGDHDAVMACNFSARDIAVFHWSDVDRLVPAVPPIEVIKVFPLCALVFRPLLDLPDPYSRAVAEILSDDEQLSRYRALHNAMRHHGIPEDFRDYCGLSKLLGWPHLVQQYDLDTTADGARLLLQLDGYSNGDDGEGWGPGGSLYFLIRDEDLRERRFDRCEFEMQFT
jgi:uncharacterized protein YwqG